MSSDAAGAQHSPLSLRGLSLRLSPRGLSSSPSCSVSLPSLSSLLSMLAHRATTHLPESTSEHLPSDSVQVCPSVLSSLTSMSAHRAATHLPEPLLPFMALGGYRAHAVPVSKKRRFGGREDGGIAEAPPPDKPALIRDILRCKTHDFCHRDAAVNIMAVYEAPAAKRPRPAYEN